MPTHRIEYTTTDLPEALPSNAKVTQVSKYPVRLERRGSVLEVFAIPANEATNARRLAAALKVNGAHFELTEETARTLAAELTTLANERQHEREKTERAAARRSELEAARRARIQLERVVNSFVTPDAYRMNLLR